MITTENAKGTVPKIIPKERINPAMIFNNTCPATMLAKRRTERVTGLIKYDINSMTNNSGARGKGTPLGNSIFKKPMKPFLLIAKPVTTVNEIIAKQKVTISWLVAVKLYGVRPIEFDAMIKQNKVKTRGKNLLPSLPIEPFTIPKIRLYIDSATTCGFEGTIAFFLVAKSMNIIARAVAITI